MQIATGCRILLLEPINKSSTFPFPIEAINSSNPLFHREALSHQMVSISPIFLYDIFGVSIKTNGHGRNTGYPVPPAQIPACATNALGSSLEYERQSGNSDADVITGLWERNGQLVV